MTRAAIRLCGLKKAAPTGLPDCSCRRTIVPGGIALVAALISISLEKTQGLPRRTRLGRVTMTTGVVSSGLVSSVASVMPTSFRILRPARRQVPKKQKEQGPYKGLPL